MGHISDGHLGCFKASTHTNRVVCVYARLTLYHTHSCCPMMCVCVCVCVCVCPLIGLLLAADMLFALWPLDVLTAGPERATSFSVFVCKCVSD